MKAYLVEADKKTIRNLDGKTLFFGPDDFIEKIVKGKCCFVCGASPNERIFNDEHVIPDWILRHFDLHTRQITLANHTQIRYGSYAVPCCEECNSTLGRDVETPVSNLLKQSYKDATNTLGANPELSKLLFRWMCLSLYVKGGSALRRQSTHLTGVLQRSNLLWLNFLIMKSKQHTSAHERNLTQKVQKRVDFSNKQLFVGIDVHKVRWQVAVYHEGLILSNTSINGSAQTLITHLRKFYGDAHFCCVYESTPFGFSLCRSLWAAGMECMVVNPADIPSTNKESRSKSDPVDARKLAMHLAAGLLHPIHVPTEKLQKQRSLIRLRKKLWCDLVRCKNRLKGELLFQGIILPPQYDNAHWSHNFLHWIEEQANGDEDLRDTLLLMLEQVKHLRLLLLKTERKLRELMWSVEIPL